MNVGYGEGDPQSPNRKRVAVLEITAGEDTVLVTGYGRDDVAALADLRSRTHWIRKIMASVSTP